MKLRFTYLLLFLFNITVWAQSDCPDAIIVCGGMDYYGLSAGGVGNILELNTATNDCHSEEHFSVWFKIQIKDGGTLGFILTPENPDLFVDFDFWLFGPNLECNNLGDPIRCSTTNPENAGLTYNTTGLNDEEIDVSEGPNSDGNGFVQWVDVEDDDIYYLVVDRPHGFSNFSIEWTGTATFHEVPVFLNPDNIPLDMSLCDNSDGVFNQSATFDLTVYEEMFIGNQTDVELTYHNSMNDMLTGVNPMETPEAYVSTEAVKTIYLRMTNPVTGCFVTNAFDVTIPVLAGETPDIYGCDNDDDGIEEFNLNDNYNYITSNNPGATVVYYASFDDAENEVNPLDPIHTNTAPYTNETIWGRLEKEDEECYDIISFDIIVSPVPVFNNPDNTPIDIKHCDDDGTFDGWVTFDLTVNEEMFIGNQENVVITYYLTQNNATWGSAALVNPTVFFSNSPQKTIYMRITDQVSGCFSTLSFNAIIPVKAGSPQNLFSCDINGNGIVNFDLTANDTFVGNGQTDIFITYYETLQEAIDGINDIGPDYENEIPYQQQTIWARIDKLGEECFDIRSFTINIYQINDYPDMFACDNNNLTTYNLTSNQNAVSAGNPGFLFTYYESTSDIANNNPIPNPQAYTSISNPQSIYVVITNTNNGCTETQTFEITNTLLILGTPENLSVCDTDGDGFEMFDLNTNQALIQNGDINTVVSYHISQQDAINNTNPINTPYQNTVAYTTQTIWVRVQRPNSPGCYDTTSFTITSFPLPVFNNPDNIILDLSHCDDDGVDDQSNEFDLTTHENMFTGNQTNIVFSYYESMDDLNDGNAIANPQAYANTTNPQTIYVQIYNTVTGCYSLPESLDIEIINPVVAGEPEDLWLCDSNKDGLQLFQLNLNDNLIKNGESFRTVTYYASLEDAENETNPLNDMHQNSIPYTGQTIWARLESNNGCLGHDIVSFAISVPQLPDIDYTIRIEDFTAYSNSITIDIANQENFEYSLDGINYINTPYFGNLIPGLYMVYIRSKDGCSEISEEVVILNYPKFFTPNGDGIHETWQVYFIYFLPKSKISIFDRYGKLVSSFWGDSIGWDGMYHGRPLPSTDYWFLLELEDGRNIRGHFAMVR